MSNTNQYHSATSSDIGCIYVDYLPDHKHLLLHAINPKPLDIMLSVRIRVYFSSTLTPTWMFLLGRWYCDTNFDRNYIPWCNEDFNDLIFLIRKDKLAPLASGRIVAPIFKIHCMYLSWVSEVYITQAELHLLWLIMAVSITSYCSQ